MINEIISIYVMAEDGYNFQKDICIKYFSVANHS
jgi:hypothetical protein